MGGTDVSFRNYPFPERMSDRLRDDLCTPGVASIDVDLILFISGERGCVVNGGNINPATRVDIASSYRINCPIPDGGSWECIGEGCNGGAQEATRITPPDRPPMPNTRLPGNDIGSAWLPGGNWTDCWRMCFDTSGCRAWTFRAAGTTGPGSQAGCLLKSRVGAQVPDTCCHSGVME